MTANTDNHNHESWPGEYWDSLIEAIYPMREGHYGGYYEDIIYDGSRGSYCSLLISESQVELFMGIPLGDGDYGEKSIFIPMDDLLSPCRGCIHYSPIPPDAEHIGECIAGVNQVCWTR